MKTQLALFLSTGLFVLTACTPNTPISVPKDSMPEKPHNEAMMEQTWPTGSDIEEGAMDTETSSSFQLIPYSMAAFDDVRGKQPVAIHFSASWCPKCRALDASLKENMASLPQDAIVFLADYDTEIDLKKEYGITLQTTVVFFNRQGEKIDTINNPSLEKIKTLLQS